MYPPEYPEQPEYPEYPEHTHGLDASSSRPVFTDPSGQRRRLLRVLGAAASVVLAGALALVALSLFGGPNTPISVFGGPAGHTSGTSPRPGTSGHQRSAGSPGSSGPSGSTATPRPRSSSRRSPQPTPSGSAPASPSASPSPTNKAGKTPPGLGHTHSPHPHSSRSTHA